MRETASGPEWLRLFKPKTDFYELLSQQAKITADGLASMHDWILSGARARCEPVHDLEHRADRHKLSIQEALRDNFVTPFDREDIYDISALLDSVLNGAKKVVKDIEYFEDKAPDQYLIRMSAEVLHGAEMALASVEQLEHDLDQARSFANQARKAETTLGDTYREAIRQLIEHAETNHQLREKHLYDRMNVIAERIELLGEKLMHVSIKLG